MLSAGSAHVAAGLFESADPGAGVWGGVGEIRVVDKGLRNCTGAGVGGWVGGK